MKTTTLLIGAAVFALIALAAGLWLNAGRMDPSKCDGLDGIAVKGDGQWVCISKSAVLK